MGKYIQKYVKIPLLASNLNNANLYWIYTLEYRCTDQPDIFCLILEHLLFRDYTQTALQSFPQMSFVWQYYVIIQGSTLTLH